MIEKLIIGIQAAFLFLLLYIFAVVFLCLGQEYTGLKTINYTMKVERVIKV